MRFVLSRVRFYSVLFVVGCLFSVVAHTSGVALQSPAQATLSETDFDGGALAAEVFSSLKGRAMTEVIVTLAQPDLIPQKPGVNAAQYRGEVLARNHATEASVLARFTPSEFKEGHRFDNFAGFSGEVSAAGLRKLLADPSVRYVEPVRMLEPHLAQGIPLMNATSVRSTYSGSGLAIAVCDTGIDYTHTQLGAGAFPNSKVLGGYDFGDSDTDPLPNTQAHGTCCAGIAAGGSGAVGDYIGGVAYDAKLYALKISSGSGGSATSAAMVGAWDWCVTHKNDNPSYPILVISTSFGGGRYYSTASGDAVSPAMTTAANNAVAAGITVLASSGNNGFCDSMGWPACISSVISVGAVYDANFGTYQPCVDAASCAVKIASAGCFTGYYASDATAADMVTSYSNTASFLTILAPSNSCYTTDIVGAPGYSTGDYFSAFGGTSAACPYAAGAVACLQSASQSLLGRWLTPSEVRDTLTSTGVGIADTKVAITVPRIDLAAAVDSLPVTGVRSFEWSSVASPQTENTPFGVTVTARDSIGQTFTGFTGTVNLSGLVLGASEVTIGAETATSSFPMGTLRHDERTQAIYLASEIGGARMIDTLSLFVGTAPGQIMNIWTIRMKHTTLSAYATSNWEGSGWTTVYQSNETVSATGWAAFALSTPFSYDGTSNLMVDFSFNNASFTADGMCQYSIPGGNRTLYYRTDSGYGDPLTWSGTTPSGTLSTNVPNIKLGGMADVPVSITPAVTGSFVDGVWTGSITVLQTAAGMRFRADDGSAHTGDSNTFNVLNAAPEVTGLNPAADATISSANLDIDVTFSKPVVGVDATDMALGGTAAASAVVAAPSNPSGNLWRFPVSGLTSGTLNINLAPDAGDIQDADGNDLMPRPTLWSYTASIPTDFGDAPAPYPVQLANDGARHIIDAPYLGAAIDAEGDGQSEADALGDDNTGTDDEDGVVFTSSLRVGQSANAEITASAPGKLDAWIDFNGDGDWADSGEQVFSSQSVVAGANTLSFGIPASALATLKTFARFRLGSSGGLTPTGEAANGEVEDYAVAIGLAGPLLNSEPAYTAGLSNILGWTAVSGAEEYYAEYDTTDAFASPDANSGWISGLSHNFGGLTDGVTYLFRVKARHMMPDFSYIESSWSNIESSQQDATLPGVAMASIAPDLTNVSPIPVSVSFTEDVSGFDALDIVPGNGTVDNFQTVDAAHYTFDLMPTGQGSITADIAAGVAQDIAGNPNTVCPQFVRAYDSVPPGITMTSSTQESTNVSPIPVSVSFTEDVSGFDALDIVPGNGTVDNFQTVDAAHYTFDLMPTGQGSVTADIAAGVAQDAAGNSNSVALEFIRAYDIASPDVTMASSAPNPTHTSPISVWVSFTEDMSGFDALDIVPGNAAVDNFQTVDAAHYTFDLTPTGEGSVTAEIAAGVAQDAAGNPNTVCPQFIRTYDSVPPGVAMTSTASDPLDTLPIPVTVSFTEDVIGFDAVDIVPGNAVVDNFQTIDAAHYAFDLIATDQGVATVEIAAGVAQDAAGNPNTECLPFSRTYDTVSPDGVLSSEEPDPTHASPIPVTVSFSESVSGFVAEDIVPGHAVIDNFQVLDAANYAFDLKPSGEGLATADIAAGVAQDAAGNPNTVCIQFRRTYDSVPPDVAMTSSVPDPVSISPISVSVSFTENVIDFDALDIAPGNAIVRNFQIVDAAHYTFDLTPTDQGIVTADIAAGAARDAAGNPNTDCAQFSRWFHSLPPLADIGPIASTPTGADAVAFSVAFNEPVTPTFDASDVTPQFVVGDVILTGSEAGTAVVTGTDPSYTVTVTLTRPDEDGLLGISIGTGVTDSLGNPYAGGASPSCSIYNWRTPYFTTQSSDSRKYAEDGHTFSVVPNCGANTVAYQWKWEDGGKTVWNGPAAQNWNLANVSLANRGVYWCEASYDGVTHETEPVTLQVEEHLAITQYPEGGDKKTGESHTFTVQTTGGYAPLTYVWKRVFEDGEAVIPDATGASYTILALTEYDACTYTVEVADSNSDMRTASAVLTVTEQSLPAASIAGLCTLLGLAAMGAVRTLRRR